MPFPYNSDGISDEKMGGKYPPLPIGYYDFQITDVKEKLTKNNDPMVAVTAEVINSAEFSGRRVWHNVTFPRKDEVTGKRPDWAGIAIHFLKTIGEPWEADFIVTPDAWIGKEFKAKTKIGKDQNGDPKTEIGFVVGKDEATDDTVPF